MEDGKHTKRSGSDNAEPRKRPERELTAEQKARNREAARVYQQKKRNSMTPEEKAVKREYDKRWHAAHPGKAKLYAAKSRFNRRALEAAWRRRRHAANAQRMKEAKIALGGECTHCGLNDFRVLQFDHIFEDEKLFAISQGWRYKDEAFFEEVAKCRLLCANCHHLRSHYSRTYTYASNRLTARALVEEAKRALGNVCTRCGNADARILHFDHMIPDEKPAGVIELSRMSNVQLFFEEVAKCQLLCPNCHHIKTHYD